MFRWWICEYYRLVGLKKRISSFTSGNFFLQVGNIKRGKVSSLYNSQQIIFIFGLQLELGEIDLKLASINMLTNLHNACGQWRCSKNLEYQVG